MDGWMVVGRDIHPIMALYMRKGGGGEEQERRRRGCRVRWSLVPGLLPNRPSRDVLPEQFARQKTVNQIVWCQALGLLGEINLMAKVFAVNCTASLLVWLYRQITCSYMYCSIWIPGYTSIWIYLSGFVLLVHGTAPKVLDVME